MADANIVPATPAEDSSKDGQPANNGDGAKEIKVDSAEQARRDQQSKKDKSLDEKNELSDEVAFLSAKEAERSRDAYVLKLLADQEKYPNVKSDDPLFKYATSQEEVEEIAKNLQDRYMGIQQEALASVQSETQQLTDEQIAQEEVKLEKETAEHGRSTFGSFMNNLSRRKG